MAEESFDFGSEEQFIQFEMWAFGYNPTAYDIDAMHAWNGLHGADWFLEPDDTMADFLRKAYKMYMQEKKQWNKAREEVDKKMAKVTKKIKQAEKDIENRKDKKAVEELKSAEKQNKKLTVIDKNVRDPKIQRLNKIDKLLKGGK